MGPPLKAAENSLGGCILGRSFFASMGPPLKAAENKLALGSVPLVSQLQWGRR